jgi:hypothetical protein
MALTAFITMRLKKKKNTNVKVRLFNFVIETCLIPINPNTVFKNANMMITALEEEGKMLGDAILISIFVLDKLIPYKRSCPLSSHCS